MNFEFEYWIIGLNIEIWFKKKNFSPIFNVMTINNKYKKRPNYKK